MARGHTTGEKIEVAISNEASPVSGILLPNGEHLDVFGKDEYLRVYGDVEGAGTYRGAMSPL